MRPLLGGTGDAVAEVQNKGAVSKRIFWGVTIFLCELRFMFSCKYDVHIFSRALHEIMSNVHRKQNLQKIRLDFVTKLLPRTRSHLDEYV